MGPGGIRACRSIVVPANDTRAVGILQERYRRKVLERVAADCAARGSVGSRARSGPKQCVVYVDRAVSLDQNRVAVTHVVGGKNVQNGGVLNTIGLHGPLLSLPVEQYPPWILQYEGSEQVVSEVLLADREIRCRRAWLAGVRAVLVEDRAVGVDRARCRRPAASSANRRAASVVEAAGRRVGARPRKRGTFGGDRGRGCSR